MHNQDEKYPVRPGFEPVLTGYKPQSTRMSHRGRPYHVQLLFQALTHSLLKNNFLEKQFHNSH